MVNNAHYKNNKMKNYETKRWVTTSMTKITKSNEQKRVYNNVHDEYNENNDNYEKERRITTSTTKIKKRGIKNENNR